MTLRFIVSLCFWHRIMRNVTFFTLYGFCSVLQTTNEISSIVSVAWSIGHLIIGEKRKVRRFISNMPDKMQSVFFCVIAFEFYLILSTDTWTFRNFARKTIAGEIYSHCYAECQLLYFIARSKYHPFVTCYKRIFFAPKRCRRVWFISSLYSRRNFHALR